MFDKILKAVTGLFGSSEIGKEVAQIFKGREAKLREFQKEMASIAMKQYEMEVKDLQDARKMQIEALKQADRFSKRFVYYLTIVLLGSAVLVTFLPFFIEFPESNQRFIDRGVDFLYIVSGARILSFFFGSKIENKNKLL
ncbi:hypothetical protein GWK08_08860 [Leptobacterium flavescens]|uniref:Uncharacterized protein n=1 Tax=Leptobacterium flavescens TaxID=472055 RepID=A0A6P0UJZ8_9FLAO|nr:hypothetical protein [Leptobacterium flavescens]NER13544.1 hypothetical protein [Leptobacterium flavescens]